MAAENGRGFFRPWSKRRLRSNVDFHPWQPLSYCRVVKLICRDLLHVHQQFGGAVRIVLVRPRLPLCGFHTLTRTHSFSATSEQALYRLLRFFYENRSALTPLLLLFRKKSRSARLLGCKRPHNGSLSLPTFCGYVGSNHFHKMPRDLFCITLTFLGVDCSAPRLLLSLKRQ